jgi:hypothetical protein
LEIKVNISKLLVDKILHKEKSFNEQDVLALFGCKRDSYFRKRKVVRCPFDSKKCMIATVYHATLRDNLDKSVYSFYEEQDIVWPNKVSRKDFKDTVIKDIQDMGKLEEYNNNNQEGGDDK